MRIHILGAHDAAIGVNQLESESAAPALWRGSELVRLLQVFRCRVIQRVQTLLRPRLALEGM